MAQSFETAVDKSVEPHALQWTTVIQIPFRFGKALNKQENIDVGNETWKSETRLNRK